MSVNNAAIEYRVGPNGDWRTIPPSQPATLLCFLSGNRDKIIVWDDMYQALGKSPEVNRCLHALRGKWGIPIPCEAVKKATGLGTYGVYRLADEVEVREPRRIVEGQA